MRFSAAFKRQPPPPLPRNAVPLPAGASRAARNAPPVPSQRPAPRELPPDLDQRVRLVGEW